MRFDHCNLFSFPAFEGDLVTGKVQGELIRPQGGQLIGVVQSNPVNAIVLPVQPVPFVPFQSPLSSSPCTFLSGQSAQHTLLQAFRGQCVYLKTF